MLINVKNLKMSSLILNFQSANQTTDFANSML